MDLFYVLFVLLIATRLFGELASRFGQPVLVGELLAGVALGILARAADESFPVLSGLSRNDVFNAVTSLGIYFLMLMAGMEMRPRDLYRASRRAVGIAAAGMVVPLGLGAALGCVALPDSPNKLAQVLFVGVSLAITAVPVTIATLMELDLYRSEIGKTIVSAAVFDDLISLFLLAMLTSLMRGIPVTLAATLILAGRIIVFFIIMLVTTRYVLPAMGRLTERLRIRHAEFSLLMLWALALSVLAERLGMHFILGAYAAGLFFTPQMISEEKHDSLLHTVRTITLGLFAPIFFASIGLSMQLGAFTEIPVFLLMLLAAAFLGKFAGASLAGVLSGLPKRSAVAVGVAMNARGGVGLIVAGIALEAGLFAIPVPPPPVVANLFSAVVIVAIITTVISPLAMQEIYKERPSRKANVSDS